MRGGKTSFDPILLYCFRVISWDGFVPLSVFASFVPRGLGAVVFSTLLGYVILVGTSSVFFVARSSVILSLGVDRAWDRISLGAVLARIPGCFFVFRDVELLFSEWVLLTFLE